MDKYKLVESIRELQSELKVIQDREQYCKEKVGKYYKSWCHNPYRVISVESLVYPVEKYNIMELGNRIGESFIKIHTTTLNDKDTEIHVLEFLSEYDIISNKITKSITQ